MDDTQRSIGERYSTAVDSRRLVLHPRRVGDVDLLISAGWVRDGLGTALYRLAAEFDVVRGEHRQAFEHLRAAELLHRNTIVANTGPRLERTANAAAPAMRQRYLDGAAQTVLEAGDDLDRARDAASRAKAMAMAKLKSLASARRMTNAFAVQQAPFKCPDLGVEGSMQVAGSALSAWLDPLCFTCNGLGFTGMYMRQQTTCAACNGNKRRLVRLGPDNNSHEFGRWLLVRMDHKAHYVERQMKAFLGRQDGGAAPHAAEAVEELQDRLKMLRSSKAQED